MDTLTNVCEATSQSQDLDNFRPTHRKGKKLLAEKKRRARINNCLMQIRQLVCEDQDEKDTDLDKMEKAEILEKTLEVLTRLRHNSKSNSIVNTRKAMAVRYASGFSSCAEESIKYIQNSRLVPVEVKVQLQNHLRAIAHRMETTVHVDNQGFNFSQGFSASSSLSASSERLAAVEMLTEDSNSSPAADRVPGLQTTDIPEIGSYCITSPVHYSTPVAQKHLSLITSSSLKKQKLMNNSSKSRVKTNINSSVTSTEKSYNYITDVDVKMKSLSQQTSSSECESIYQYPDICWHESALIKQNHHLQSPLSSESSYSHSHSFISDQLSSISSPFFLHPTPVLPTTPVLPYHNVYGYHGYEHNPVTSSVVVQSTQLKKSPSLVSIVKQIKPPNSTLDLCYKKPQDQQISPETMWRPW